MGKTLFVSMKEAEGQIDADEMKGKWIDSTKKRWNDTYSKLEINDSIIIRRSDKNKKFYIAKITNIDEQNETLHFDISFKFDIKTDELLTIDSLQPEMISVMKGIFQPFIVDNLNIKKNYF